MKRPTTLLSRVLLDEALQTNLAVERDIHTIECRFKDEGMSFLTITLPSLDDALIQGLTKGFLTPSMFHGFKPCKRGGKLPAFMAGFFRNVFNEDGWLKDTPCIRSIRAIRQVTRLYKKVELPCSAARQRRAFERYVSNDQSISGCADSNRDIHDFCHVIAGYLWSDLEDVSGTLYCFPGIFGSGATAEGLALNERHSPKQWPERGDESFPASYHTTVNEGDVESLLGLTYLTEAMEQPVRVVQVPKTLKTPRTISVEPSYMMLRQQSIAKPLMDILEQGLLKFKSIRFTNQFVNRELARIGSIDGSLATIDLSDASDLVSNDLVKSFFQTCPSFLTYLQDSRSSRAQLPDASQIVLKKFASMGSALCFPIEAMVFYTITLASMVHQSGRRPSNKLLAQLSAKIAVYGDDIIVPTEMADGVMTWLEALGLRVNHEKSFTKGFFRESCGGDYYRGEDITPSYVRQWADSVDTRNPQFVAACVSLSNQFYMKGLWYASQYIRDCVEAKIGKLARTTHPVGCLTWASLFINSGLRYESSRCGYSVRGPSLVPRRRQDHVLDIRGGLLVAFGSQEQSLSRRGLISYLRRRRSLRGQIQSQYLHNSGSEMPSGCGGHGDRVLLNEYSRLSQVAPQYHHRGVDGIAVATSEESGLPLYDSSHHDRWRDFGAHPEPGSWKDYLQSSKCLAWSNPPLPRDLSTSVRPYALKIKRRLVPVHNTGLVW